MELQFNVMDVNCFFRLKTFQPFNEIKCAPSLQAVADHCIFGPALS